MGVSDVSDRSDRSDDSRKRFRLFGCFWYTILHGETMLANAGVVVRSRKMCRGKTWKGGI